MIHTKDNPKLVRYYSYFEGIKNFTGVVKDKCDTIAYYLNGKWHREDGPAIEYHNGGKEWYVNDKLHRTDGPAVEGFDGEKSWYLNGKLHREDGPAVEEYDGEGWYLNGKYYGRDDDFTNESWIKFVRLELLI